MKSARLPDRSFPPSAISQKHASEAAVILTPFLLCMSLIGALPWIAG
ncbi:hypothetical protein [Marinobacter sp. CHS3-4]|nr:hypothetical protein [Marinobacter sp. CHS3-4]MDI9246369.1 hypothetical protein [Marinobacter sp. CHS3-4]